MAGTMVDFQPILRAAEARAGDVARALQHWGVPWGVPWGVADRPPKGKGDRQRVQAAFNGWAAETGRPLSRLSMILALSAV